MKLTTKKKEKAGKERKFCYDYIIKKLFKFFRLKKKKNHLFGLTGSIFIGIFIFLCRKGGGGVLEKKEKWQ